MLPRDYDPRDGDPQDYLDRLEAWETRQNELIAAQSARAAELVEAQRRLDKVQGWVEALRQFEGLTGSRAGRLGANAEQRAGITAELEQLAGLIADFTTARELATARLLAAPGTDAPLLLLPLRLETRWSGGALHVRIYPDEVSVDRHDPALTADEARYAAHYWQVRAGDAGGDAEETWQQLVRRYGPARAAWLVRATRPGAPAPVQRNGLWPRPARVALLPDRFAVVAFSAGVPVNLAAAGEPPRYVTWTAPVSEPLELGAFDADPGIAPWWRDLAAAREAGMAVSLPVREGLPPVEALLVAGVRGAPDGDLSALLAAHSVSSGVEVLADGTPTNNSAAIRSAYAPEAQEAAARRLRDAAADGPPALAPSGAGARLVALLGLQADDVAVLAGADADRDGLAAAARLLVGLGAQGAMRRLLGAGADAAWGALEPGGPLPPLRVGRQPYGIVPVTAPAQWHARDGERSTGVAGALQQWGAATGPPVRADPVSPPAHLGGGAARRSVRGKEAELATLLLESASSVRWTATSESGNASGKPIDGTDGLIGPAEGGTSPTSVLAAIADAAPGELAGLPQETRTGSLLARIAVVAKRTAPADQLAAVDAALRALAGADRGTLARMVAALLDAASHRFDAWVTAAATERAAALRQGRSEEVAVGAYGWVTDVAPRAAPRSYGHIHAPSLGQAATAAVLRSGFLGQRARGWDEALDREQADFDNLPVVLDTMRISEEEKAARLEAARILLEQHRAGRAALAPLDEPTERRLPLAVDLSSRRVRGALWVLSAVRAGQPLGAVLGYQFERDLADAGLLQYLSVFRKLTRFSTGTALEALEQARRDRRGELAAARGHLAQLQRAAADLRPPLTQARDAERLAGQRQTRADAAYAPYATVEADLSTANGRVTTLQGELGAIDAGKPAPASHPFHVTLP